MEEDTHAGFAYTSHSEHFMEYDIWNKQCFMDYYENHLKSKTPNKLDTFWKYCDVCKNNINNSSWNKLMKKHKTIAGSADEN